MTTLKQGDLITRTSGVTRKVMEVYGTILFISSRSDHDKYLFTSDEKTLKEDGYTRDTPAWKPSIGEMYSAISEGGWVFQSDWHDSDRDRARRDFLGIYETKKLAEAAILEIRRKLGK